MTDVAVNQTHSRFETIVDGTTAYLSFHRDGKRITLVHTEVPDALGGRGVGSELARFALDYARSNGLTVVPRCPFVRSYLERHPDETGTLDIEEP